VREKVEQCSGFRQDYFSPWIIKHVPQIRTNFCLTILSSACSWRIKIFTGAGRVSWDNIFVLKLQRARPEKEKKRARCKMKKTCAHCGNFVCASRTIGVLFETRRQRRKSRAGGASAGGQRYFYEMCSGNNLCKCSELILSGRARQKILIKTARVGLKSIAAHQKNNVNGWKLLLPPAAAAAGK